MHRWIKCTLEIGAVALIGVVAIVSILISETRVPRDAIEVSVTRHGTSLERAWDLPVASTFSRANMVWQSNVSLCGPASLANVFRSLGDVAASEDSVLAGTGRCRLGVCIFGLTLDQLAEVARNATTRNVTVLRNLSPDEFREHMKKANDPNRRYIINFSRDRIFGTGAGHYSPIGGYLEEEDLVFVLDVNRAFQPWLIERERLYDAMNTFDGGKKRGLLLIE